MTENERLREALEFYADVGSYRYRPINEGRARPAGFTAYLSPVAIDGGKQARAALCPEKAERTHKTLDLETDEITEEVR